MYQKDQLIIYGNSGVCRIDEIGVPKNLPVPDKGTLYYKLTPIHGSETIYVPVDSSVFMRPVLTREQAIALISKIPEIPENIFPIHNQKAMAEYYRSSIQSHQCEKLVQLIKTVRKKDHALSCCGKKLGKTDLQYMKQAKILLEEEISVALKIPFEETSKYIEKEVQKYKNSSFS